MKPGTVLWLLAHEIRLSVRQFAGKKRWGIVFTGLFLLVCGGLVGVPLALALKVSPPLAATPAFNAAVLTGCMVGFTFLLSPILSLTVMAFFERGDFDLLLSSPVKPERVLVTRCLAVATSPFLLYAAIAVPLVLPIVVLSDPRLMGIFGLLIETAMLAAAAGLALAMGLFRLFGARKIKTIGQVLAAIIGAVVFLLSQMPNYLPHHGRDLFERVDSFVDSPFFQTGSPLSWFGQAALGAPLPHLGLLAVSATLFYAAVKGFGPRFARVAAMAAGGGGASAVGRSGIAFSSSFKAVLVRKELTLIARDPALISQVLLRCLYFVPMVLALGKITTVGGADYRVAGVCGWLVLFASQIAGSLAWIAISAEDAPDLIKTAPQSRETIRTAKIVSALLPVGVLCALPLTIVLLTHPWMGLVATAGVWAASYCVCYVNLWYEKPQKRSGFRRRGQGSIIANLGEVFLGMAFLPVTVLMAAASLWALPWALLPVALLGGLYWGRRQDA